MVLGVEGESVGNTTHLPILSIKCSYFYQLFNTYVIFAKFLDLVKYKKI